MSLHDDGVKKLLKEGLLIQDDHHVQLEGILDVDSSTVEAFGFGQTFEEILVKVERGGRKEPVQVKLADLLWMLRNKKVRVSFEVIEPTSPT